MSDQALVKQQQPAPGQLAIRDRMEAGGQVQALVPRTFAEAQIMCEVLARAGVVPKHYQESPANMLVVIMSGAELGLPPMQALRLFHFFEGSTRLSAEGMRAVIIARPECAKFRATETTETRAVWVGRRTGDDADTTVTWTIERANKAGLGNKQNWRNHPASMLNARASMELARLVWPDIVAGLRSTEEDDETPSFASIPEPAMAAIARPHGHGPGGVQAPRRGRPPKNDPSAAPVEDAEVVDEVPPQAPSQKASPVVAPAASADPMPAGSSTTSQASTESAPPASTPSATSSSASGEADDDFGTPPPPTGKSLAGFHAWLATCRNRAELKAGKKEWIDWSVDVFDKATPEGRASADEMSDAFAKRMAEVPQ